MHDGKRLGEAQPWTEEVDTAQGDRPGLFVHWRLGAARWVRC